VVVLAFHHAHFGEASRPACGARDPRERFQQPQHSGNPLAGALTGDGATYENIFFRVRERSTWRSYEGGETVAEA
jgi:hypothetical protein